MNLLGTLPWYFWLLFVLGLVYIGSIIWICFNSTHQIYSKKTPGLCIFIIIFTLLLIIGAVAVVLALV